MTKKVLNKSKNINKAETVVVKCTITRQQEEILKSMVGVLGSNEQDVIAKIITLWLYNEGYLKPETKKADQGDKK